MQTARVWGKRDRARPQASHARGPGELTEAGLLDLSTLALPLCEGNLKRAELSRLGVCVIMYLNDNVLCTRRATNVWL